MVVRKGRAEWLCWMTAPAGPADRWDIGEIVTLAMMPDRWDILGDPGPVRVSPSLRPIGRIPQPAVGCSSRGLQTCAWGAARATGTEQRGSRERAADRCATKWG